MGTFILIFWLGQGAGTAEFANMAACTEAHYFDYYGDQGRVLTQCHESDKPMYSQLLGPDGKPLPYAKFEVGFRVPLK